MEKRFQDLCERICHINEESRRLMLNLEEQFAKRSQDSSESPFEPDCPYYRDGPCDYLQHGHRLMFRLREQFVGGSEYVGDSLGDRTYIDTSKPRSCLYSCLCWRLQNHLRDEFVFIVSKTTASMKIEINSVELSSFLFRFLSPESHTFGCSIFDGLELLRIVETLHREMCYLKKKVQNVSDQGSIAGLSSQHGERLSAELSLLLNGLMMDNQVFQSFGYENLYEDGHLTYGVWKAFQGSRTLDIIDQLENAFSPETENPDTTHSSDLSLAARNDDIPPSRDILASRQDLNTSDLSGRSKSLPKVGAIIRNHQEAIDILLDPGRGVDDFNHTVYQYPLILRVALDAQNSDAISKILMHTRDFEFLYWINDADRWRFATTLIRDYGVAIQSILDVLPKSTATKKRLRCALFDSKVTVEVPGALSHSAEHYQSPEPMKASRGVSEAYKVLTPLEVGMVHAIKDRDIATLSEYFNQGVDPSLGLSIALSIQDAPTLALLLERGADPECIIPSKAESALMAAVEAGNCAFVDLLLKTCNKSDTLLDVDFVHDEWTPLMIAVQRNHRRMVQSLLRNDANPEFQTSNGTALDIAMQNDSREMLDLLLESIHVTNPGPLIANYTIPTADSTPDDVIDLYSEWISKCTLLGSREKLWNGFFEMMKPPEPPKDLLDLQILRREFRKQHDRIVKSIGCSNPHKTVRAVQSGYDPFSHSYWRKIEEEISEARRFGIVIDDVLVEASCHSPVIGANLCSSVKISEFELPYHYKETLERDWSKAWRSGIRIMRDLCAGILPSNFNDILMFIAVAKAICSSGSLPASSACMSSFDADLGRWQVLFKENALLLKIYQQAVHDIWEIDIGQLHRIDNPDSDTLTAFQDLATSLANVAEQSFGLQLRWYDDSLLTSQKRWHERNFKGEHENQCDTRWQASQASSAKVQAPCNSEERPPKPPDQTQNSHKTRKKALLRDEVHRESKLYNCSPTVILLMAGFIFIAVLIFMLVFQNRSHGSSFDDVSLPMLWIQSLRDAVEHLTHVVRTNLAFDYQMAIEDVRRTLLSCIKSGTIVNFSSLVTFIQDMKNEPNQSCQFAVYQHLIEVCKLWEPSYVLQERFQVLQACFGLKGYRRIVESTRIYPAGLTDIPEAMPSDSDIRAEVLSSSGSMTPSEPRSSNPRETAASSMDVDTQSIPSLEPPPNTPPALAEPRQDLSSRIIRCDQCPRSFVGAKALGNLNKHRKDMHEPNKQRFPCRYPQCRAVLSRKAYRGKHEMTKHGEVYEQEDTN